MGSLGIMVRDVSKAKERRSVGFPSSRRVAVLFVNEGAKGFSEEETLYELPEREMDQKNVALDPWL
jgi:hypothetical protein